MAKLPVLSGDDMVIALTKGGFVVVRQKGSHISLQKDNFRTVVPLHKELAKGTILGILKQAGLTQKDLLKLLNR